MTGGGSKEVDAGEYCSFPTFFNLWMRDFPDLKVSRPVEDICKDCYAFENRHRYLSNRTMGCNDDDGKGNGNGNGNSNDDGDDNNDADGRNGKGIEHADKVMKPIQCVGLNPYKIVEMYKNYRPNVPIEYHSDLMYAELGEEVWSKVKV